MRGLVALPLVLASLPLAVPPADACHPALHYGTPTDPQVGVTYSSSRDPKRTVVCVSLDADAYCVGRTAS